MADYAGELVRRSDGVVVDSAVVSVGEAWDNVADGHVTGDLTVAPGERWLIGPNLRVDGHVFVEGTGTVLAGRPGSHLIMTGGDPSAYVGGGLTYDNGPDAPYTNDIGIWMFNGGSLDIQGTPKASWNRTGTDPTWEPGDEYWIAPTGEGNYTPQPWTPGDPIPRREIPQSLKDAILAKFGAPPPWLPLDWWENGIPTEVCNVTRDVVIEADTAGHIHIHSQVPQRVEYARIEGMGVFKPGEGQVLGRYALHQHMAGYGSRGSIWRGLAAVNSRGRVFVPHESHGITIEDCVSLESYAEAYWWDIGDHSHDAVLDHMLVLGVNVSREINGGTPRYDGITLGKGDNTVARNCAVAGVRSGGSRLAVAYDWPERGHGIWDFDPLNVAHNNTGPALRFWTNGADPHVSVRFPSYDNGAGGIETGAYRNAVRYADALLIGDHIRHHSNAKPQDPGDGGPARYERVVSAPADKPPLILGNFTRPPYADDLYVEFVDCQFIAPAGHPKVHVVELIDEGRVHFIRCGLEPADIEWADPASAEGTRILIDHEDGRSWEIEVVNGQKNVTTY